MMTRITTLNRSCGRVYDAAYVNDFLGVPPMAQMNVRVKALDVGLSIIQDTWLTELTELVSGHTISLLASTLLYVFGS
jgi:hypothetical protein